MPDSITFLDEFFFRGFMMDEKHVGYVEKIRGAALVLRSTANGDYADREQFWFIADGIFEQIRELREIPSMREARLWFPPHAWRAA